MRRLLALPVAAAAALMATLPAAAAVNLIKDGEFTQGATAGSFTTYAFGSAIGPWLVIGGVHDPLSGSVDLIGTYWPGPPSGGYSVDLDGTLGNCRRCSKTDATGGVTQIFMVPKTGEYDLTFEYAANTDGPPTLKVLDVTIGSLFHVTTETLAPEYRPPDYTDASYEVKLYKGVNDLSFISGDFPASNQYGPVIGNVSVSAVPELSTWAMMLAGFAGLGFAGYRRSRKNATLATA